MSNFCNNDEKVASPPPPGLTEFLYSVWDKATAAIIISA